MNRCLQHAHLRSLALNAGSAGGIGKAVIQKAGPGASVKGGNRDSRPVMPSELLPRARRRAPAPMSRPSWRRAFVAPVWPPPQADLLALDVLHGFPPGRLRRPKPAAGYELEKASHLYAPAFFTT